MSYPFESVEWVPCAPMFVPDGDGFALTADALALLDPPPPAAPSVAEQVAALRAEARALAADLPAAARVMVGGELLAIMAALQEATSALAAGGQAVVAELDRQGTYEPMGATSTATLLVNELRVRPAEASRRVRLARECVERVGLDGQVLPPVREHVATAQAAGVISADHAAVICSALNRLPLGVAVEQVEAALVELAGKTDPRDVAVAGRQAVDLFDPDGPEPRDEQQRRRRGLTLTQRDDGAGTLTGELTADLLVKLQTVLSPLAQPRPDDAHGPDTRSPAQRWHDALEDVCDRLLRSGTLPDSGGVPATVTVTMTLTELRQAMAKSAGRVDTSFGDLSTAQLLTLVSEAEIIPVVLNDAGGILAYGQTKRFATAAQTKALRARDQGCTFPGCDRPPEWCERHHILAWMSGGPTDLDNLTLLCGYHHRSFESWGWQVVMDHGKPRWIAPEDLRVGA